MCAFAIVMNKIFVKPYLAAGPPDGNTCPPFERTRPNLGEGGVSPGKGFDADTQNHLIDLFTYANICVNWDYYPSRELTAMIYPIMEYTGLIYIFLDFVADMLANMRGDLAPWVWTISRVLFPVNIFLMSQFRMIFVNIAYVNTRAHTAGFLCLQLSFILIGIQNCLVIFSSHVGYAFFDFLGGGEANRVKNTRNATFVYLILLVCINTYKMYLGGYYVATGIVLDEIKADFYFGLKFGQFFDYVWMVFNMILPLYIAYKRSKLDSPLKVAIGQDVHYIGGGEEEKPLAGDSN